MEEILVVMMGIAVSIFLFGAGVIVGIYSKFCKYLKMASKVMKNCDKAFTYYMKNMIDD